MLSFKVGWKKCADKIGNKEKTIAPKIIAPSTKYFRTNTYFYSFSVTLSKVGKHILFLCHLLLKCKKAPSCVESAQFLDLFCSKTKKLF
jgi:hypothetical protein